MKKKMDYSSPRGALLNPCTDAVFKALFTSNSDASRKALTSFLSAVLEKKVSHVELEPNELPISTFGERQSSFDIACILDDTEPANIEMQTSANEVLFKKRIEYHSAHLLNYYVEKGDVWQDVPKTYQISIVDFIFDASTDDYVSRYQMRTADGRVLESRQNIIVIELPKIAKLGMVPPENLTNIAKWGKFFVDADDPQKKDYVEKIAKSEDGIMNAQETLLGLNISYSMWSAQEHHNNMIREREMLKREIAVKSEKALQEGMWEGMQEGLQLGIHQGMLQGIEQGLQKGMLQGIARGLQQGILQGAENKAVETARAFLSLGVATIEQIAQATGLPLEKVQELAGAM